MEPSNFAFRFGFVHGRGHEQQDRARLAELNKPLPPNMNPPHLTKPTRLKLLKRYAVGGGKVGEPGEVVTLPGHDARDALARGHAVLVED